MYILTVKSSGYEYPRFVADSKEEIENWLQAQGAEYQDNYGYWLLKGEMYFIESIENISNRDGLYVLIQWPESQEFMDEDWFQEEAVLANEERFGSAAYFIPLNRIKEN